jgi:hypothetical protein
MIYEHKNPLNDKSQFCIFFQNHFSFINYQICVQQLFIQMIIYSSCFLNILCWRLALNFWSIRVRGRLKVSVVELLRRRLRPIQELQVDLQQALERLLEGMLEPVIQVLVLMLLQEDPRGHLSLLHHPISRQAHLLQEQMIDRLLQVRELVLALVMPKPIMP